jgi:hypothetical protein
MALIPTVTPPFDKTG